MNYLNFRKFLLADTCIFLPGRHPYLQSGLALYSLSCTKYNFGSSNNSRLISSIYRGRVDNYTDAKKCKSRVFVASF